MAKPIRTVAQVLVFPMFKVSAPDSKYLVEPANSEPVCVTAGTVCGTRIAVSVNVPTLVTGRVADAAVNVYSR